VRCQDRSRYLGDVESLERFFYVAGHREVDVPDFIVPVEGDANIKVALDFDVHFIELAKASGEVVEVRAVLPFDAKVFDNEGEDNFLGYVAEEAVGGSCSDVAALRRRSSGVTRLKFSRSRTEKRAPQVEMTELKRHFAVWISAVSTEQGPA